MDGTFVESVRWKIHSPAPLTRSPPGLDFYAAPRSYCDTVRRWSRRFVSATEKKHRENYFPAESCREAQPYLPQRAIPPTNFVAREQIFSSLEFRFRHISRPTTSHTFVPSCCPLPLFYLSSRDRLAIINVLRRQLSVLSHLIKRRARRIKYQVPFFLEIYIMPCEVISNVEQSINFDETILEILIFYKYPKSLASYPIKI